MAKILGIDPGSNSIGLALRNTDIDGSVFEQLEHYSSVIFEAGVGNDKTGEYSYASRRRKYRMLRRHYQVRKYRKWSTLQLLIENNLCPLSIEELDGWRIYNKNENKFRHYPDSEEFMRWVRLDFDGDGVPDYTSPYQLRAELAIRQFDFTIQQNMYKLGRALYHIAQRRGFKSSRLDKNSGDEKEEAKTKYDEVNELIEEEVNAVEQMQQSEIERSKELVDFMKANNCKTIGQAFAQLENNGVRIRAGEFKFIRKQSVDEVKHIFEFQEQLSTDSELYLHLISTKPDGTIFYQRPLRSQKGSVGRCTMEPTKQRCAISHPDYETFRAYCFLNNIRYRRSKNDVWQPLNDELRKHLYETKFLLTSQTCDFGTIRKEIERQVGYKLDKDSGTINYRDDTTVSLCPVSARLKKILGDEWRTKEITAIRKHPNGTEYTTSYNYVGLWNICFQAGDVEFIKGFAEEIELDAEQTKQFIKLWGALKQGYAMLSLKAIRNINRFLERGFIYSYAVLLAKLPEVMGEKWADAEQNIETELERLFNAVENERTIYQITNNLIAKYKALPEDERFAYKDFQYQLQQSDLQDVENAARDYYGEKSWNGKTSEYRDSVLDSVSNLYQLFFEDEKRAFYRLPEVSERLKNFIIKTYGISEKQVSKLYHPSMIDVYPQAKYVETEPGHSVLQLGKPDIGAIKNPMVMRVMHIMRRQINDMLKAGLIDENTKVIVEIPREFNDANKRKAIEIYQRHREAENKAFEAIIKEICGIEPTDDQIDTARLWAEQHELDDGELKDICSEQVKLVFQAKDIAKMVERYRLWHEQDCLSIYTGKPISLSNLFDENKYDIEHTLPRSRSFDNSLANKTICEAWFNRDVKGNRMPSELDESTYKIVLANIEPWKKLIEHYKQLVQDQIKRSRRAATKEEKDKYIQRRHIYKMYLDYWTDKVSRFEMREITSGFLHRQLTDTQIISKYVVLYLKSLFKSVYVQKGGITADVRKVLGIQPEDKVKDRSLHSHHAIDATMLTLMPPSSTRDRIFHLFYAIQEAKRNGKLQINIEECENELRNLIAQLRLKGLWGIKEQINSSIIVHHISQDRYLQPTKKRCRVRGRIVKVKDAQGKKVIKWMTGDTVRGQLHKETLLGAIKKQGEQEVRYVVRKQLTDFNDWSDLEKVIVNQNLIAMMRSQFTESTTLSQAREAGIYMLDRNGNKVNLIRHVRCYTKCQSPIAIREFEGPSLSKKEWKHSVYADNDTNVYEVLYWDGDFAHPIGKKVIRLMDAVESCENGKFIVPQYENKKHQPVPMYAIMRQGIHVLVFNKNEELFADAKSIDDVKLIMHDLPLESKLKRLYVMKSIFSYDAANIIFQYHINAQPEERQITKGGYEETAPSPYLRFVPSKDKFFLIEGVDFRMTLNDIIIK